ncbi:hypothetical protein GCM10023144_30180 [Pigmentiphaga soli]|uniref:Uncharacterized protein n=1 Tax=Pigmentiphaga soli TaxID=1007095 RepID=A0ABP8H989_9BURK
MTEAFDGPGRLRRLLAGAGMAVFDELLAATRQAGRHATARTELEPQQAFDRMGARRRDALSQRYAQPDQPCRSTTTS